MAIRVTFTYPLNKEFNQLRKLNDPDKWQVPKLPDLLWITLPFDGADREIKYRFTGRADYKKNAYIYRFVEFTEPNG